MDKTAGILGLAHRAGALTVGSQSVVETIKKGKAKLVLVASDASELTKKLIYDKSGFRNIPAETIDLTVDELGSILGKTGVAAVAISDKNFVDGYRKAQLNRR